LNRKERRTQARGKETNKKLEGEPKDKHYKQEQEPTRCPTPNPIEQKTTSSTSPSIADATFPRLNAVWSQLWEAVVVASVLLGLLLGILQLRFNIAVDPSLTLDSKLLSQQGFTVSNNGPFDLYHVKYSCRFTITKPVQDRTRPSEMSMLSEIVHLPVGARDTIHCTDGVALGDGQSGLLQVDIVFKPRFSPFRRTDSKVFGVTRDKNGDIKMFYLNRFPEPVSYADDHTTSN